METGWTAQSTYSNKISTDALVGVNKFLLNEKYYKNSKKK